MTKKVLMLWILSLIGLLVFSYTQIDLNLTLSSNWAYQNIQNHLIQLGYFNRPLNTLFYFLIYILFVICYLVFVSLVRSKKIDLKLTCWLIGVTGLLILFSYPAFSHDIFNYIFDAKILGFYAKNPYLYSALDFPNDLWTRFMHWTHRTYPYGPIWLIISLPFLFLGLGKFSSTLLSFKLLFLLAYLLSCFLMYKISQKIKLKNPQLNLILFALNPLVIFEGLIAGHLDLVMVSLVLAGVWFWLNSKKWLAGLFYLLAAGVKFIPVIFIPSLFLSHLRGVCRFHLGGEKHFGGVKILKLLAWLALLALLGYSIYRRPQPWYWLLPFSLSVLLPSRNFLKRFLLTLTILQPLVICRFFILATTLLCKN
jgi:hypothetical protein